MKTPRNTVAKTEILKLINQSAVALSHSEIQEALKGLCDRVTIYRVLERLLSENEIHKVVNLGGVVKYAACNTCEHTPKTHHLHKHVHFSCEVCQQITCLENIEPMFQSPTDYTINQVNFTLSGICPKCK